MQRENGRFESVMNVLPVNNPVSWPVIPLHLSLFFISQVFVLSLIIFFGIVLSSRNAGYSFVQRRFFISLTVLFVGGWLLLTQLLSVTGFFRMLYFRPDLQWIVWLTPFIFGMILYFMPATADFIRFTDGFWLVYIQSFRIFQDFVLYLLFRYHIIPQTMSIEGYHFDFIIGLLSLPVSYYCYTAKKWGPNAVLLFNLAGIFSLIVFFIVALGSMPFYHLFPINMYNSLFFRFPFIWIPLFSIPFALMIHLFSIRKVWGEMKSGR